MASWHELRGQARATVHGTFCREALYFAPGSSSGTTCLIRRHMANRRFGDLDREGYAQAIESLTEIVIDLLEIPTPERNARIEFVEDGINFHIDLVQPSDDDRWSHCQVARIR